jgi:hypothetical protein
MKTILSVIGESVVATCIIIICFSLQPLLELPGWTLPLLSVPAMLYLDWRLGEHHWPREKILRWVVGRSLFMFLWLRLVPAGSWWLLFVLLIIFPPSTWLSWRQTRKEGSHKAG